MSGNTFGKLFCVTSYGESHGKSIGCIIDGCPPGIKIDTEMIQIDLDRRKPGTSRHVTQRSLGLSTGSRSPPEGEAFRRRRSTLMEDSQACMLSDSGSCPKEHVRAQSKGHSQRNPQTNNGPP